MSVEVPSAELEALQISSEETPGEISNGILEGIPIDERFQYDDKGRLLGAAFDRDLFVSMTSLARLMNPEWQLLLHPNYDNQIQLAYELCKTSMYYKLFVEDMFQDKDSQALVEDVAQFEVTKIDVIENPFLYSMFYLKWQELRRRNGRVQEMLAYCVAPSFEDVVMGELKPAGSDRIKFSATVFPLIDASKPEGALVYCKVLISKTGKIKTTKQSITADTLAAEDGSLEKFAQDEVYPICIIHYKLCK